MQLKDQGREKQLLEDLETAKEIAKGLEIENEFSKKIEAFRLEVIQASKVTDHKIEALGLIYNSVQALLADLRSREREKNIRSISRSVLFSVLFMGFFFLYLLFDVAFRQGRIPFNLRNFVTIMSLGFIIDLAFIGIFTLYSYIFVSIFKGYLNRAQKGEQSRNREFGVGLLYLLFLINILGYAWRPIGEFLNESSIQEGYKFFDNILTGIGTFNPISIATTIPIITFYYSIIFFICKAYIFIWGKFIFRVFEI